MDRKFEGRTPGPHPCSRCSGSWAIVNACGCDPHNLPTRPDLPSRLEAAARDERLSCGALYSQAAIGLRSLLRQRDELAEALRYARAVLKAVGGPLKFERQEAAARADAALSRLDSEE